ncbi:extracellular solute-binding protein [Ottowia pentelensis]
MSPMDRRRVLQLAGAAGLAGALPAAQAQGGADLAKAKAEGTAVFYANITAVKPIMEAFDQDTGIKGEYTRISSSKFVSTVATEARAGKLLADVVQAPQPVLELLKANGMLAPYRSPAAADYPDWTRPDDTIQLFGVEYVSYLYNTQHVQAADAPKRYEDLADPKWANRIVMANPASHSSTISWLIGLKEKVFASEGAWMDFVKGLAANRPMFVASFGPTPAPVESGEKAIAISMPKYIVTKAPAPLAWGRAAASRCWARRAPWRSRPRHRTRRPGAPSWITGCPRRPPACWPRTWANTWRRRACTRRSKASPRSRCWRSATCPTPRSRSGARSSSRSSRVDAADRLSTMEIRVEGLSKHYVSEGRSVKALDQVDLVIPANQIFTLLGPSGCGKTTLLRCIVGLETPDEGEIRIGDQVVWSRRQGIAVPTEKRGLGMVFQTYAIWPHMSVFDNVAYPLQVRGMGRDAVQARVGEALRFVQLEGLERRSATRLSGGQQQRVALARALVAEPKVILFDEPLSNLDAKLREETRKELRRFLGQLDITALYVTHDRVEALALSDSIAVMRAGRIVEIGSPRKIYFQADHRFVADFIGRANLIDATVRDDANGLTQVDCALGPIDCAPAAHAAGSAVTLCLRPEFLHVQPGTLPDGRNVLHGRIESLEFVGEVLDTEVRVGNTVLLARSEPDSRLAVGDTVSLAVRPEHCLLVSA